MKRVRLDRMREAEARQVIRWEAEQHVPFDIESVSLDFEILDPEAASPQMEVVIVAAKKDLVETRMRLLEEGGFEADLRHVRADGVRLALAGGTVDVNGTFGIDPAVENAWEVRVDKLDVGLLAAIANGWTGTPLPLSGGTLSASFSGSGPWKTVTLNGNLQARGFAVAGERVEALDATVGAHLPSWTVDANLLHRPGESLTAHGEGEGVGQIAARVESTAWSLSDLTSTTGSEVGGAGASGGNSCVGVGSASRPCGARTPACGGGTGAAPERGAVVGGAVVGDAVVGTVLARTSCGMSISTPVPPRADGRKEIFSPCLRASRPTTARPSRVPESVVRSAASPDTARSARRSWTSLMTSPESSTEMIAPAGTSSTYTWTSAVGGEKLAALSRSSASACMTPSAA